jgi:peroxiredoxin
VAVHRRLLAISLGAAVVVGVVAGWALSGDDAPTSGSGDSVVHLNSSASQQDPSIGTNAVVKGTPLPAVTIDDGSGHPISTRDLVGHPMIINVWFSTCGPCKTELPAFAKVHADLGDKIRFVGINPSDTPETNQSFAHERGVAYELLRDPDGAFVSAAGIVAFPVTLFVTADGTIVRQTGALDESTLRADAQALLG